MAFVVTFFFCSFPAALLQQEGKWESGGACSPVRQDIEAPTGCPAPIYRGGRVVGEWPWDLPVIQLTTPPSFSRLNGDAAVCRAPGPSCLNEKDFFPPLRVGGGFAENQEVQRRDANVRNCWISNTDHSNLEGRRFSPPPKEKSCQRAWNTWQGCGIGKWLVGTGPFPEWHHIRKATSQMWLPLLYRLCRGSLLPCWYSYYTVSWVLLLWAELCPPQSATFKS